MNDCLCLDACIDATLTRVGKRLRLATPLGIGKPNPLLNAFYRRAAADPSIELHIFTALSLARPKARHELERRLLEPIAARLWGDYPELEYESARAAGTLPPNVRVFEFYFQAGKYLEDPAVQRDHIASNYTHVVRDVVDRGVNVLAQQVVRGRVDGRDAISLHHRWARCRSAGPAGPLWCWFQVERSEVGPGSCPYMTRPRGAPRARLGHAAWSSFSRARLHGPRRGRASRGLRSAGSRPCR